MYIQPDSQCVQRNRGSLSAFVACLVTMFLALAGLTFDGGRVISEYVEMADIAENAARAGSQMIVDIRSGNPQIDVSAARAQAEAVLRLSGIQGTVGASQEVIEIRVRRSVSMKILSLFGVGNRSISITRRATPVVG
ncbi:MAG: hypothetical protein EXQ63_08905 [Ilumatobacteraceae bacterium]|nr:hypothetical protein [Ilumatobacteraceae bacterium]